MQKWSSSENVNGSDLSSNDYTKVRSKKFLVPTPKKRLKPWGRFLEQYTITIKPKLHRSSSLSNLTSSHSDFTLDLVRQSSKLLSKDKIRQSIFGCGDGVSEYAQELTNTFYMSWMPKLNKLSKEEKEMPVSYGSKFATDFIKRCEDDHETDDETKVMGSYTDDTSLSSADPKNLKASFPFQSTPSGNLKVQSNQVVFQSSTVGVLLADPTQAKIKVKFEGGVPIREKANVESASEQDQSYDIGGASDNEKQECCNCSTVKKSQSKIHEKRTSTQAEGKDLMSLGYNFSEPIDWKRLQLPKKQDLFQEFYRRIHNFINTDTVIYIGDEEFHCHRIVLQIYSPFFDQMKSREIQLPCENVTPEAFHAIYDWMILGGNDSTRMLKRTNILDLFIAAQYLCIKDLEEQCWAFLVNEEVFNEDTAHCLCRDARSKGLKPVVEMMVPRIMKFFLPLVASKDFLDLELDEVISLMKSNNICVSSEIEVLMAGVRWLYGDWPARSRYIVDIMSCARFGLISPWQLVDIKRNPDNAEILEIVNHPEVQQMVDDGLAYVIIKYWYGNNSKNYYHWIDVLGLTEPAERNWIGEEKNHVTYKDFLVYLEQFALPKEEMYEMLSNLPPARRSDDVPGGLRGENDPRRPKMDFQLPSTLKVLTGDREQLPTMSEFFEHKGKDGRWRYQDSQSPLSATRSPLDMEATMQKVLNRRRTLNKDVPSPHISPSSPPRTSPTSPTSLTLPPKMSPPMMSPTTMSPPMMSPNMMSPPMMSPPPSPTMQAKADFCLRKRQSLNDPSKAQSNLGRGSPTREKVKDPMSHLRNPPKKASQLANVSPGIQPMLPKASEAAQESSNTGSGGSSDHEAMIQKIRAQPKRLSVAATYLAAATAAIAGNKQSPPSSPRSEPSSPPAPPAPALRPSVIPQVNFNTRRISDDEVGSPKISLFNHSKESLARMNMNKLSHSVLGPTNKNYILEGSLFNWDRETVLVFGGIDPHNTYGVAKNTGKDIYRFDPVANIWEVVGELPEPRHHHSVAFLKGRVYLVGGADPRDDDVHGKSVVVSTVWSLEPVSRSWHSEAGLSVPRKNFGLVVHRMALYAIGGQDKKGRVLRSVERFDYKSCTWSEVRSMSLARMAVAAVKYREYIWVAGGMTGDKRNPVCKTVECYNSNNNEWTQIHSLRFPRCFATMFTMNDKLYILGGAGKTTEKDKTASSVGAIDVWDWTTRRWRHETDMSIPRHGHALAYLGTQLCIIGGVTTIYMRALNNVESYCCERGAWIRGVAALPSSLSGHGAVTLPPASLM